ncbi:MAG: hypothetical protein ABH828_06300 [archaeon]
MDKIPLIILGGFETDKKKIEKKNNKFLKRYGVHYLEGPAKPITIKINDEYIVQKVRNEFANSKYFDENRIFLVGPQWLYENRLDGFNFVNYNNGMIGNLERAFKEIGGGVVGITTSDIPLVTTQSIYSYVSGVKGLLHDPNLHFIVQMFDDNFALKDFRTPYKKPTYKLRISKHKNAQRLALGHLHFCNIDNVSTAELQAGQAGYNVRGENGVEKLSDVVDFAFKNKHLGMKNLAVGLSNLPYYGIKFLINRLTLDDLGGFIQKMLIDKEYLKRQPNKIHFRVEYKPDFAFDLDTIEEVKEFGAEYTPIEKVVGMEYDKILEKSTISNSQ